MPEPSNTELMLQYLSWCKNVKRFSDATVSTYMYGIQMFLRSLDEKGMHLTDTNRAVIREYHAELVDRANKRKEITKITINDYRMVLKSFYTWLVGEGILKTNHWAKTARAKPEKPKHDAMSVEQLAQLIYKIDTAGTFLFRDTILFELFWNSGLRTSEMGVLELSHLQKKPVTLDDKTVTIYEIKVVNGKGGKDRYVPLNETTTYLLKKYLTGRKLRFENSEYLFPNNKGGPLHRRQIYEIIRGFLDLTHTKKKGAHVLRHTYATMLLNNGVNLMAVQKLLGHSKVTTTTIYAKPSSDMLKREFNKAHPKGDKKEAKEELKPIPTIKHYVTEKKGRRVLPA